MATYQLSSAHVMAAITSTISNLMSLRPPGKNVSIIPLTVNTTLIIRTAFRVSKSGVFLIFSELALIVVHTRDNGCL